MAVMPQQGSMPFAVLMTFGLLVAGMALTLIRLIRGPSAADRVTALDLLSNLALGFIAAYAIATGEEFLLDPALALSIVTFLATVAFARYLTQISSGGGHE